LPGTRGRIAVPRREEPARVRVLAGAIKAEHGAGEDPATEGAPDRAAGRRIGRLTPARILAHEKAHVEASSTIKDNGFRFRV